MEVVVPLVLVGGLVWLGVVTGLKGRGRFVLAVALSIPVLGLLVMFGLFEMISGGGTPFWLKVAASLVGAFILLALVAGALMRARSSSRWARRHSGP